MALVECVKYGQNMLINYWKFDQIFVKQTKKRGMVPSKNWCPNLSSRLCSEQIDYLLSGSSDI